MFELNIKTNKKDLIDLSRSQSKIHRALVEGMRKSMYLVEARAKERMGSRPELRVITGNLRRSIRSGVDDKGKLIQGWVGTNCVYGRTHELGDPKRNIPARPYLSTSIEDKMNDIINILENSIIKRTM